jgi:ribosomal protein L7Ae-like RNA K-turn-binding protein
VNDVAKQRLLRLIGLGVRARGAVVGVQQVRQAAKKGGLAFAVIAPDASQHSLDKLVPLLRARRIRFADAVSAAELGAAVGRESTAAVGIVDQQLAKGIRDIVESSDPDVAEPDRRSV